MNVVTLHISTIPPAGDSLNIARAVLEHRRARVLHGHDFHELIWVQNGTVRHHLPDRHEDLSEGDLLFIRPGDRHHLQGLGDESMVVTVQFDPGLIAAIGERHPQLAGRLFWSDATDPARVRRDMRQLADLNRAALRIERGPRDSLAAEGFLVPLCAELAAEQQPLPPGAPDWLATACAAARDPAVFREGAAGFARIAGRAHPHVSRMTRRYLDMSPSDVVNAQRMAFAARRLTASPDPLAEIAADCGITNLSHFHKLFRTHHGMTPLQFRKRHQRDVIQP